MLRELQDAFRRGVLEGDDADARALIASDAIPAERRLAIYRNNTFGSLVTVLQAAFPVVCRLVGEPFFRQAAAAFVRAAPPRVPQLLAYGDAFPDFLAGFPPARSLPYLADTARLEWARQEALFAADAAPLAPDAVAPDALAAVPPETVAGLGFELHPSARLVASRFPILRIWQANQPENATVPRVDVTAGGEAVLVLRPDGAVHSHLLSPGDLALVKALDDGAPLAVAAARAAAAESGFDLQQALAGHLTRGTFAAVRAHDEWKR
jgi:hypothetical protein